MHATRHSDYQSLSPDHKRAILFLAPLLRIADGLDTSRQQKVMDLECLSQNGAIQLKVRGEGDIDLELWTAERATEVFKQVYERPVVLQRVRRTEDAR